MRKKVHVLDDGMGGACSALGVRVRTARASPVVEDAFANNVHVLDDGLKGACSALGVRDRPARAVAGESSGIIGLHEVSESDSSLHISRVTNSLNSSLGVDMSGRARAASALPAAAAPRSCSTVARLSNAVGAHAHASPMHCARNSGGTGGLLLVQGSTSYCLDNSWSDTGRVQGPTGTRRVKGGVSGLAEDLLPVSEVEAWSKFSAGRRCTGAGCRFTSREATRHRYQAG